MKIFKTLSKRGLALFLVLTMCVSLLPTTALAAEAAEALHTHNEDGWACVEESQLICGYEQEHTHDETCWAASEKTLACSLEEAEGHQHDESCYTEETTLACGQEESEEHSHDETCYVTETVLSCGQEEAEGHTHGEDCFAAGETVLTCELEEHQHGEACYASVWTCTEPSEDVSRFLRAVKAIPEEITAENVEEAEVRIAEAIEAYQHLGGAEKSNASVVRAYDVILAAEIAVEAAKNGAPEETPETVLPEDAVVIDPAVLVEYTGVEEEEVAVADLFTFVANTYLVDEEDPDVVTLPASLYFVGENVEERFDIMDILFPAESEDELPEEPERVALTADSIVYQDVPVTAYFLPEETVAQDELLMEMGNDEVELLLEESYNITVGESITLSGAPSWGESKNHTWTQSGEGMVTFSNATIQNVTITGSKAGKVILTHMYSYRPLWGGSWKTATESTTVTVLAPEANEIRFDLNGGTGTAPNAITFEDTQTPVTLPSGDGITRSDYQLLGWALYPDVSLIPDGKSAPQGVIYELGDKTFVPSQDGIITLYAVWGQVTGYQPGNIRMAIRADNKIPTEPSIQTASYSYFTDLTGVNILDYFSPAHTVAGVEKVKLCLTEKFHQHILDDAQSTGYGVSLAEDKVIDWYVIKHQENDGYWHIDGVVRDKEKVSLTYNGNGNTDGLAPDGRNDYTAGDKATVANQGTLVKTGYEFDGWNTVADGSGEAYQVDDQIQLNENVTLYAQWRQKGYQVRYVLDGGKLDGQLSIPPKSGVKWDQSGLTPSGTPVKDGYQFEGWYLKDAETVVTTTQKYSDLAGNDDTVTTVTLVAKWTADAEQTKELSYTVEYYKDNVKVDGDTLANQKLSVWVNDNSGEITLASVAPADKYTGYKFSTTNPAAANGKVTVTDKSTVKVYYVKDASQTHDLSYTVEYYKDNVKVDGDTLANQKLSVWVNDNSGEITLASVAPADKYTGYKFSTTNPAAANGKVTVTDKSTVKVYYVKDESAKHSISAQVDYYFGDTLEAAKAKTQADATDEAVSKTEWIGQATTVTVEPNITDKFTGYAYNSIVGELSYTVDAGEQNDTETHVVKVYYVKDNGQTKALAYTVQYYLDGQPASNAETYTEDIWVNSDQTSLAVQAGSVNTTDKFEGYTFDYSNPTTIPGTVADGTVIRVYYARDVIGTDPENPNTPDGIPDKYQATVTFNVVNGTWTGGETSQSAVVTLMKDGVPAAAVDGGVYQITDGDVPNGTPNAGYLNTGAWRDGRNPANAIINGDTTFTFTYALIPVIPPVTPPGGGGGGGGGTTIPDGPTPLVPDPGTTITDQDVPLAAPGLNNTDHFDYIKGYVIDGQILVRPEANITRAEVATIFFRLMTKEFREANWATENDFTDVKKGDWYNNAISTCTKAGILKGYEDGTFKPNQTISREEFAAIAARFASEEVPAGGMFKDIAGRWSEKDIERAAAMGWIKGSNGLFRPVDKITRAEVIVIVNRMLDRVPDADHMLPDMKTFADNTPDMWWYADVQEATNSHEYDRAEDGVTGIWTSLLPEQDWAALEKEWATAADANVADVAPKLGTEGEKPEEGAKEPETAGGSDGNGEE